MKRRVLRLVYIGFALSCFALLLAAGTAYYFLHGERYALQIVVVREGQGFVETGSASTLLLTVRHLGIARDYAAPPAAWVEGNPEKGRVWPPIIFVNWAWPGAVESGYISVYNGALSPGRYTIEFQAPSDCRKGYSPLPQALWPFIEVPKEITVPPKTRDDIPVKVAIPR